MKVRGVLGAMVVMGCGSGETGPAGAQGAKGDPGELGPAGEPGPAGEGAAVAGSRLRPRFDVGADGARAVIPGVWFDQERQEECSFRTSADGQRRCLPTAWAGIAQAAGEAYRYHDADDTTCITPLVLTNAACPPGTDTYAAVQDSCAEPDLFRIVAFYAKSTVRRSDGIACDEMQVGVIPDGYTAYLAEAVPASAFVAGSVE